MKNITCSIISSAVFFLASCAETDITILQNSEPDEKESESLVEALTEKQELPTGNQSGNNTQNSKLNNPLEKSPEFPIYLNNYVKQEHIPQEWYASASDFVKKAIDSGQLCMFRRNEQLVLGVIDENEHFLTWPGARTIPIRDGITSNISGDFPLYVPRSPDGKVSTSVSF